MKKLIFTLSMLLPVSVVAGDARNFLNGFVQGMRDAYLEERKQEMLIEREVELMRREYELKMQFEKRQAELERQKQRERMEYKYSSDW